MTPGDAERAGELAAEAGRRAGVRLVIQAGAAGLAQAGQSSPDVIGIGDVPHDWLFPQMAAVVHHAGAGTTGAGLRAGVPAVTVPMLGDQPFWAARLARLGVGPRPIPYRRLSARQAGRGHQRRGQPPVLPGPGPGDGRTAGRRGRRRAGHQRAGPAQRPPGVTRAGGWHEDGPRGVTPGPGTAAEPGANAGGGGPG